MRIATLLVAAAACSGGAGTTSSDTSTLTDTLITETDADADTDTDTDMDTDVDTDSDTDPLPSDLNGDIPDEALPVPVFTAVAMDGTPRTQPDLIGAPTVMWFYPAAFTGG